MNAFEKEVEETRLRNKEVMDTLLGGVKQTIRKRVEEKQQQRQEKRVTRAKRKAAVEPTERRASARLSGKSPVNYSERSHLSAISPILRNRPRTREVRRGDRNYEGPCASEEAQDAAREAAENLTGQLDFADYKRFTPSIVGGGFWCDAPPRIKQKVGEVEFYGAKNKRDMTFLVGENTYDVVLLSRGGFSGGWRGLAIKEEYNVGDYGVFEWVDDNTIRLHVFRAADYE
ncbi:hypothetical protein BSKO_06505 [Bryopsis sp. KO-2023]|nr:hypothetical protein BSKO_06505 [Bryopsis sp. KO-2023]